MGVLTATIGSKSDPGPGYRYRAKEQPPLPEMGIAKGYKYEFKLR